jgi:galactofuranose transport system substrate-binding protein
MSRRWGRTGSEERGVVKISRLWVLLVTVVGLMLIVACSPPGAKTEGQGGGSGGKKAQQDIAQASGNVCKVKPPNLKLEDAVVGFSQSEKEVNPFRIAETESIRSEAKKRNIKELVYTNANSQAPKQISDIRDMIAQDVDAIIVAPLLEEGMDPALNAAKEAGVPVFLIDRETAGTPCEDYITFMGSDFFKQGKQAADLLANFTNEKAQVAVLEGTPGASVTIDRTEGFEKQLKKYPNMEIVASQTGEFLRTKGQTVMEQLIQSNPDINAVYAENDEMALGAIQALKDAGKDPGQDVKVVSIDGTRQAVQAIITGDINAVIETNPRFGPLAFDTIEKFLAGKPIPQKIIVQDDVYTKKNAQESLDETY